MVLCLPMPRQTVAISARRTEWPPARPARSFGFFSSLVSLLSAAQLRISVILGTNWWCGGGGSMKRATPIWSRCASFCPGQPPARSDFRWVSCAETDFLAGSLPGSRLPCPPPSSCWPLRLVQPHSTVPSRRDFCMASNSWPSRWSPKPSKEWHEASHRIGRALEFHSPRLPALSCLMDPSHRLPRSRLGQLLGWHFAVAKPRLPLPDT